MDVLDNEEPEQKNKSKQSAKNNYAKAEEVHYIRKPEVSEPAGRQVPSPD